MVTRISHPLMNFLLNYKALHMCEYTYNNFCFHVIINKINHVYGNVNYCYVA